MMKDSRGSKKADWTYRLGEVEGFVLGIDIL